MTLKKTKLLTTKIPLDAHSDEEILYEKDEPDDSLEDEDFNGEILSAEDEEIFQENVEDAIPEDEPDHPFADFLKILQSPSKKIYLMSFHWTRPRMKNIPIITWMMSPTKMLMPYLSAPLNIPQYPCV